MNNKIWVQHGILNLHRNRCDYTVLHQEIKNLLTN